MLKNITLTADAELIRLAREKARKEKTSLNKRFRQWLQRYVNTGRSEDVYYELMDSLSYAQPGRSFTREEMNER